MTFEKRGYMCAAADDIEEQQPDVNDAVSQLSNPQIDAAHSFAATVSKYRGFNHKLLIVSENSRFISFLGFYVI